MAPESDPASLTPTRSAGRDASEAEGILTAIESAEAGWTRPLEALQFDSLGWTPSLVNINKSWVLHVHLSQRVPRYIAMRIRAAKNAGYSAHIALHLEDLYEPALLVDLADIDAHVYVVRNGEVSKRKHVLAALADERVPVDFSTRRRIAKSTWDLRTVGNNYERGHRLEALLAFLLSQVGDFVVFSRNYRNATQEIDIILQVASHGRRSWHRNSAFILVESKNTHEPAGQPQISLMFQKLRTKRGSSSIAFFFSVGGYTSDAWNEEIRSSSTEYCIAMFDAADIEQAIDSEDLANFFENKVSRALLR